jgi:hypothetical protein
MISFRTNEETMRLNISLKPVKVAALVRAVDNYRAADLPPLSLHASIISLMSFLRFFMLLSLVIWLGGLIFLAFVEAPIVFSPGLLPTRHMAGSIVGRSLDLLHYMAIASGIIFLITSMFYNRMVSGSPKPLAVRHVLIAVMLLLTVVSQFAISPKLHAIRNEVGVIDNLPLDNPQRREFDRLHVWSEKFEEAVLLLGLVALYTTAQALR